MLQLQVDIVRVIEDEEPILVGLARKPTQTHIHSLLGFSWDNCLKIRFNSVLVCGVNVEDIGEAENIKLLLNHSLLSCDGLVYRLPLDSSINLNAS